MKASQPSDKDTWAVSLAALSRACWRTARAYVSPSTLIGAAVIVGILVVIQGIAVTYLSSNALSSTESTLYRNIATPLAENFRKYSEQYSKDMLQMRLNEVAEINPNVRLYIINDRGIVQYAPQGYGRVVLPFVDPRPVGYMLRGDFSDLDVTYGDDPHNPRAKVPFSVAALRLGGESHYLYVVTSSGAFQNYFERAASLRLGLSTFVIALASTGVIVAVVIVLMYRKLKAVSTSLAVLSHDLRGPLTSIQNSLEAMVDKGVGRNSQELQVALRSTKSATAMLNDLHHISKIQATEDDVLMEPLSLGDLLMDCVMAVKPFASEKKLEVSLGIPQHLPLILGNLELVERMTRNLLDNAIRYTPAGGAIDVSVSVIGDKVRVTIHDNGVGIPEEQLSRVSERFVRGGNVRNSVQGSGIGLSVAAEVARMHGGPLKILSREGEGTAILFDLPVWNASSSRKSGPSTRQA
jgi:signal transduction histidine kinase